MLINVNRVLLILHSFVHFPFKETSSYEKLNDMCKYKNYFIHSVPQSSPKLILLTLVTGVFQEMHSDFHYLRTCLFGVNAVSQIGCKYSLNPTFSYTEKLCIKKSMC